MPTAVENKMRLRSPRGCVREHRPLRFSESKRNSNRLPHTHTGGFGILGTVFPLIGVAFTLGAIGRGIYCCVLAQKYNGAYAAYKERHMRASLGQGSP